MKFHLLPIVIVVSLMALLPGPGRGEEDRAPLPRLGSFVAGMDPVWQPWIDAGRMSKDFFHITLVRPTLQPSRSTYATRTGDEGAVGITVIGKSTREILIQSLRLPSPSHLVDESGIDLDARWDVIFSRPSGWTLDRAWDAIAATLCEVAGIATETFRGEQTVLEANAEGTRILRYEDVDWLGDPSAASLRALPKLLAQYEKKCGTPVVRAPWQARLYVDTRDVEVWRLSADELRRWLAEWGVRLSPARHEVELTRVVSRR